MSEEILEEALNANFVTPEREFKGEKLASYTEGSRLLMTQLRDENDTTAFFIWSFVYLHIQIKKNKKEAIKMAWNKDLFRENIMEWICGMSENDREVATALTSDIIEEANKARVEVAPAKNQLPDHPGNQ